MRNARMEERDGWTIVVPSDQMLIEIIGKYRWKAERKYRDDRTNKESKGGSEPEKFWFAELARDEYRLATWPMGDRSGHRGRREAIAGQSRARENARADYHPVGRHATRKYDLRACKRINLDDSTCTG